jgi:hypothetical protein
MRSPAEPPTVDDIRISEALVVEGSRVKLSWTARNAMHVEVETVGRQPASGEVDVLVHSTRAFRIVAVNPFGRHEALSPIVRAIPLPRLRPLSVPAFPVVEVPAVFMAASPASTEAVFPTGHAVGLMGGLGVPAWLPPIFSGGNPSRGWS